MQPCKLIASYLEIQRRLCSINVLWKYLVHRSHILKPIQLLVDTYRLFPQLTYMKNASMSTNSYRIFQYTALDYFCHFQGHMVVLCFVFGEPPGYFHRNWTNLFSLESSAKFVAYFLNVNLCHWINKIFLEFRFTFPW